MIKVALRPGFTLEEVATLLTPPAAVTTSSMSCMSAVTELAGLTVLRATLAELASLEQVGELKLHKVRPLSGFRRNLADQNGWRPQLDPGRTFRPLVEEQVISLASVHAKVRRGGYRKNGGRHNRRGCRH